MIVIDLSSQEVVNADPKAIQQINFTANLNRAGQTAMYFIIDKVNETILYFFARNCKSIVILFCFNIMSI